MEEIAIKENSRISINIKDILKNDEIIFKDENEYKKIKDELQKFKNEQEKEVEDLEKELEELKKENSQYNKVINNENNNISLDKNEIETLKKDIIKEIQPRIDEEVEKIQKLIKENLAKHDEENKGRIESKYKKIEKNISDWKTSLEEKYINQIKNQTQINMYSSLQINEPKEKEKKKVERSKNNNNILMSNIKPIKNDMKNNNNSPKNNDPKGLLLNINCNKYKSQIVKIQNDINYEKNKEKEKEKEKKYDIFQLFNNIFFKNKEQTSIKVERINEEHKKILKIIFFNNKKENKEKNLRQYFDNFLKVNVFKIFKRNDISPKYIENIKYNIESILECFDYNKDYYQKFYYPEQYKKEGIRNREKSVEAARKFRKYFDIDESIIIDEELIKRLDKNDNDIYKVFQQMFG